jgi:DNA-binding response OmpR family regulator
LTIDPVDHRVTLNGQRLSLTATEYRLLEYLVRRAESIVTRDQLAEYVWGGQYAPASNVADVYVGYVRRKLHAAHPLPRIHTVRGLGYILKGDEEG